MPPSVVRWAFHTPLRLATVCVAVAGVLVGGVLLATSQVGYDARAAARPPPPPTPAADTPAPATSPPTSSAPTASETPGAHAHRQVTQVSRAFVDAWAQHGRSEPRARWLRGIEAHTTTSLHRGLAVTDPARLPQGRARRVDLEQLGAFAATTRVTLTSGLEVELRLVTDDDRWLVADVRPG